MESSESRVVARKGEEFEISLTSTPSTGYIWDLVAYPTEVEVVPVSQAPSIERSRNIGGTGTQIFRFRATTAGSYTITFALKRPWEKHAASRHVLRVNISD